MIDHELVYDAAGNLVRVDVVGDLNCDGEVTFDDLDAFMLALTDPSGYAQAHPDCSLLLGDVNGDGQLTFDDIDYWVALVGVSAVAGDRYEYDHENRLTAVRGPGGVLKLRIWYDALGRRILSETYDASGDPVTTTRHIYDGLAAIVEFECAGAAAPIGEPNCCGDGSQPVLAREFIWGDRFPEPLVLIDRTDAGDVPAGQPEHLYFVHDALGSVVGLTNDPAALAVLDPNYPGGGGSEGGSGGGSGGGAGGGAAGVGGTTGILPALVERYDYDPYGATYIACRMPSTYDEASETRDPNLLSDPAAWQPCESSRFANPFLWTAQSYDPGVRLYQFLFRTYSPTLGRWVQRDPAGHVDGVSLYECVSSAPTRFVDPLGLARRVKISRNGKYGGARLGGTWVEHANDADMTYGPHFHGPDRRIKLTINDGMLLGPNNEPLGIAPGWLIRQFRKQGVIIPTIVLLLVDGMDAAVAEVTEQITDSDHVRLLASFADPESPCGRWYRAALEGNIEGVKKHGEECIEYVTIDLRMPYLLDALQRLIDKVYEELVNERAKRNAAAAQPHTGGEPPTPPTNSPPTIAVPLIHEPNRPDGACNARALFG